MFFFFFFKQKTAYEITRRDWSSDVCSSDLFFRSHPCPPPRLTRRDKRGSEPGALAAEGWTWPARSVPVFALHPAFPWASNEKRFKRQEYAPIVTAALQHIA